MAVEFKCQGCSQLLRVGDEHAGQKARCPHCEIVVDVPPLAPLAKPVEVVMPLDALDGDKSTDGGNPYVAPQVNESNVGPPHSDGTYKRPHRGAMILTFGILGIAGVPLGIFCIVFFLSGIFGVCAFVMGKNDLQAIRHGQMDPSGHSLTQVGMVLGIISTCLMSLAIIAFVLLFTLIMVG